MSSTCIVIAAMALLVALTYIQQMPTCPFCGKTREHAHDCPTQRGRERRRSGFV